MCERERKSHETPAVVVDKQPLSPSEEFDEIIYKCTLFCMVIAPDLLLNGTYTYARLSILEGEKIKFINNINH